MPAITQTTAAPAGLIGNRGFALVTALIFLLVLMMLGVAMARSVAGQERMAGNIQQKIMALVAAGYATYEAQGYVDTGNTILLATCDGQTTTRRVCEIPLAGPVADTAWDAGGHGVQLTNTDFPGTVVPSGGVEGAYAAYPQYYAERVAGLPGSGIGTGQQYGGAPPQRVYRITAWGVGGNAEAVAVTRTLYVP